MEFNTTTILLQMDSNDTDAWYHGEGPLSPLNSFITGLDLYLVPIIIFVGLIGNTTSFVVFMSKKLRSLSSSVYLAALAVADNGFLVCVFFMWSANLHWDLHNQRGWCQLFVYLTYVFSCLSVWYVVAFTVERFIAVRFPFKRSTICTAHKARIVVAIIACVALLFYNFLLWTTEVVEMADQPTCHHSENSKNIVQVFNNIDTVITLIIPMLTIFILNVKIAQRLVSFHGEMKQILRGRLSNSSDSSVHSSSTTQVTKMLLVVSTTFLVLNLPGHLIRVHIFFTGLFNKHFTPSGTYIDCQNLFQYIYYINFATNFFLYSICAKNFRHALVSMCSMRPLRRDNSEHWIMQRAGSDSGGKSRREGSSNKKNSISDPQGH